SSDPKPREGTETCIRKVRTLETLPTCRQTQNPERGRKLEIQHHIRSCGMLPKSSDPKPREGTETLRRRIRDLFPRIGRQTQNPERGRKPASGKSVRSKRFQRVVRPKTPRGDGNLHPLVADTADFRESSDPKPREGTETCIHSSPTRRTSASRQTQNPERGRKHHPTQAPKSMTSRRQTQNPERGRKLAGSGLRVLTSPVVVRPKTPRGDGNTTLGHAACRPRF
ncbi:hypothetical protein X191_02946, partial [Mycobacterium tuberculosis BTB11-207]